MADQMDVKVVTLHLGGYNGSTIMPLLYIPATGGGITVLDAQLVGPSAGTVIGGILCEMSDIGTPAVAGTIGAFAGTVVTAAGVPAELTISTAYVDGGQWIGFDQTSGTVPAGTFISMAYVMGK